MQDGSWGLGVGSPAAVTQAEVDRMVESCSWILSQDTRMTWNRAHRSTLRASRTTAGRSGLYAALLSGYLTIELSGYRAIQLSSSLGAGNVDNHHA